MKLDPYPHHSSLFFGCDRVNDGNYWQEALERGRIASKAVRVPEVFGSRVVIEGNERLYPSAKVSIMGADTSADAGVGE